MRAPRGGGALRRCADSAALSLAQLPLRVRRAACGARRPSLSALLAALIFLALPALFLRGPAPPAAPAPDDWMPDEPYTVVMTTFKRRDLWEGTLRHYAAQRGVAAVVLVWNNVGEPLPPLSPPLPVPLAVHRANDSQTQNRYGAAPLVRTAWLFNVDDDVRVGAADLRTGYEALRLFPDQLVGYTPRRVWCEPATAAWHYSSFARGAYHVVIGQAFWAARATFAAYAAPEPLPSAVRALVADMGLGDDLALNALTALRTRRPPVWVRPGATLQLVSRDGSGKSARPGWKARRSLFLARLARLFGNATSLPLVPGHLALSSLHAPSDALDALRFHPLLERLYAALGIV